MDNISLLVAVLWHHESLEVGRCKFMINAPVVWVLHGEHPLDVEHYLVEKVGSIIVALGDIHVEAVEVILVLLV